MDADDGAARKQFWFSWAIWQNSELGGPPRRWIGSQADFPVNEYTAIGFADSRCKDSAQNMYNAAARHTPDDWSTR
jgi:hypothetical protein